MEVAALTLFYVGHTQVIASDGVCWLLASPLIVGLVASTWNLLKGM